MKRNIILISVVLFLAVVGSFITYEYYSKPNKDLYKPLLERYGEISTTTEWINTKATITTLQTQIRHEPGDLKAKLMLALAYMQEARTTGEHPYYYPAALELIEAILEKEPRDASTKFETLVAKATILLSLHHFQEALEVGNEALKMNASSASIYGVLCDANVELGNYEEGIKMADKMVSIRPDIRSYARVSYLREIYGQTNGAIEAMKMAAAAGYPGLEQTAWTKVTLGHLYEKVGDLENAKMQYAIALQEYPHYAFAIAGLGKIEEKKKNYKESIALYSKAAKIIPEFSFVENLVKVYEITGEKAEAQSATRKLIKMMEEDAEAGHAVDLEMANIYSDIIKDYSKALDYAKIEYKKRPANIDVAKAMASIYYKKNDIENANKYITAATRTNKQDPSLLCLHGLIKIKSGDTKTGIDLIHKSFAMDPYQNDDLTPDAMKYNIKSISFKQQ